MDTVKLGSTGLEVSVAGLGSGGDSHLGFRAGEPRDSSIAVIRTALDNGITFFDTAELYRTEELLAEGLGARREGVVVSTKGRPVNDDGTSRSATELRRAIEGSLARLKTDYIDVYHLHMV
jgi:L-galactose dehydrogenase